MGRGSRTPSWLHAVGLRPAAGGAHRGDLGYATRHYRLDPDVLGGDWGTLQGPTPACPRGGALARIEGDRWIVTLFGLLGDHPPTDPAGFEAFADSLTFPDVGQAIRSGEPLDDPVAFRFPASVRRRYERLRRFPDGLLPIGDAVCSLNPIYGQGMTVAALQALALREHVRAGRIARARPMVPRQLARIVDAPWDMVVGGDLAIPEVAGPRTAKVRASRRTSLGSTPPRRRTRGSPVAFARVMALVDPPPSLLRPGTATRVVRGCRPGPHRRARPPARRRTQERAADRLPPAAGRDRPTRSGSRTPSPGSRPRSGSAAAAGTSASRRSAASAATRGATAVLCVVEEARDVVAIERTREYRGRYHVLGGAISPIDGIGPDDLHVKELIGGSTARRSTRSSSRPTPTSRARRPRRTCPGCCSRSGCG
jgi:hypothetical protein